MAKLSPAQRRVADTFAALANHYGYNDGELAMQIGMSRAAVQSRRGGDRLPRTKLSTDDLERLSEVFGVPIAVLYMERAEAIRWVLENIPGGGFPATGAEGEEDGPTSSTRWYAGHRRHLRLVGDVA